MGRQAPLLVLIFSPGKIEIKSGPCPRGRFHPDVTAVPLHDLFTDGQADTGAGIFISAVEPLKDNEDALLVLRRDADAVILHRQEPVVFPDLGRDVNPGRLLAAET